MRFSSATLARGFPGNLRERIEEVVMQWTKHDLNVGKGLLLTAAGIAGFAALIVVGMMNAPKLRAQAQLRLAFEVASVKENRSGDFRNTALQFLPSGRFVVRGIPLMTVIAIAYDLPYYSDRLTGGPDWMRTSVYDIEATAEPGAIPVATPAAVRRERMRMMLQTLFADRFKMMIRRETRERPVYAVTVAKGGPKLVKAAVEEENCVDEPNGPEDYPKICHAFCCGQGQGIHAQAVSLPDLALGASSFADRPVIDKTGVKGLFNIQTEGWVPMRTRPPGPPGQEPTAEDLAFADPARPTLFQIFDRLGLKLEPQRAAVEVIVIEGAERPSEN
jgi:uncharacterized protein (TIGR03435 family)